jgi:aspartate 1-decarboxylase
MFRTMLKSKIHRATVTQADPHHVGSVTIDAELMDAADLCVGEQVTIVDAGTGACRQTHVIAGERGSGVLGVNGAAANVVAPGDVVVLIAYGLVDSAQAAVFEPRVVYVDEANKIVDADPGPATVAVVDVVDEAAAETRDAAMLDALLAPER